MTKNTTLRPTDAECATAAMTYIGSDGPVGVDICGPIGSDGEMDIIGWEQDDAHTGEWTLDDADAHLASLGLRRTSEWTLSEAPEVAGDTYECSVEPTELEWVEVVKAHWEDEAAAQYVPMVERAWARGESIFAVSDGTIREEYPTLDEAAARFLDFIDFAIDNAPGDTEVAYWRGARADGVNLLSEPPSPLHTSWSDAVQREVLEPLGADSADFDIDAIAGETIAEYTHRSDSGAVRQGCYSAVSTEEFWAIAAKNDVASAAVEKVNAYNGDNIWQDVILRLNGYDEDATSDVDPNHKSDAFVVARRVIRHDQARGEWFSAETIDEYRDTDEYLDRATDND